MRKTELTDQSLCDAIVEMERGLIDADLGGGVIKKRIAMAGRGKSGGARTLIATNRGDRWFFVYGFAKNDRANISTKELEALRLYAADLLRLSVAQLDAQAIGEQLQEICVGERP